MVETNHLPHLISLIVSEEFFDSLTDETAADHQRGGRYGERVRKRAVGCPYRFPNGYDPRERNGDHHTE